MLKYVEQRKRSFGYLEENLVTYFYFCSLSKLFFYIGLQYICRMYRIPSNEQERNNEVNSIKQIAINNGYKIKTINKLENKIKHKITK